MDNHEIDIRSEGREAFDHALAIFMGDQMGGYKTATHFAIIPPGTKWPDQHEKSDVCDEKAPTFVLFWSEPRDWNLTQVNPLPYKMKADKAGELIWGWLLERPQEEYAEWMDHDGSMGRGFRMWNEAWTHVGGSGYGICAVRPIFAWYGK